MPFCPKCGSEVPEGSAYCPKCGASLRPEPELRLAYWWDRFLAWLIDVAILTAIAFVISVFVWAAWPGYVWAPGVPRWFPFASFGPSSVLYFLYWMLMDGMYGQSFGKMVMRIRVTRLDGRLPNAAQAAIESVGKAFLLPIDCIVGWVLYPSRRQRLFNRISDTVVVRV